MASNDATIIAGLRRFLDGYTAHRHGVASVSPAPGLLAFLDKARPLLHPAEGSLPPKVLPSVELEARLTATFVALREPLQRARARGDLMQVWAVAGLKRDEVRNAAVLAWFLDPRGSHGYGSEILRRFLARAAEVAPGWPVVSGDLATTRVRTEERPLGSDRDRVDITIDGDDFCFFVEVKIDAQEGQNQLARYLEASCEKANALRKRHAGVIYLSRRPPSAPAENISVLTWRHVAKVLLEIPEIGIAGALARQYAHHIRAFY